MADKILVTRETLRANASDIRTLRNQNQEVMAKLNNLIYNLRDVFEGESYEALLRRYMEFQQIIKQFNSALDGYASSIDKTCQEFELSENKLTGKFNGI